MKIENRLRRLEDLAAVMLRCPCCRYAFRYRSQTEKQYCIAYVCQYCGFERIEYFSVENEFELEAMRIALTREPGALFRDERVFAASTWLVHRQKVLRRIDGYYNERRVATRKQTDVQLIRTQPLSGKLAAWEKRRLDEKNQAISFLKQMAAAEKSRYGKRRLPLNDELDAIAKDPNADFMRGSSPCMSEMEKSARQTLYRARVMQACERVLWNQALDETAAIIVRLNNEIRESEKARSGR